MNDKFSVLMSVYCKENPTYLEESLASIFNQSIVPNEVVLIEDGKLTNGLDDIIVKYEKKYKKIMKVIKYEKNRGLGKALRDGVVNCSNEIIFRMDTDDISVTDRFEKTLKLFKKNDIDVVGGNIAEYDENMKNMTGYRKVPSQHKDIIKMMKRRNAMNHVTVAYKRSKVIEAGNYIDMPYFEDYYLWVRMLQNGCVFANVDDCLVKVRCGDGMIKRRGGFSYIKKIYNFEKSIYKLNFISFTSFVINMLERSFVSIIPNFLRSFLYKKILRKKAIRYE